MSKGTPVIAYAESGDYLTPLDPLLLKEGSAMT